MGEHPGAGRPPGFRILLAYDLSPEADRAAELLAGTTWPNGTVVRVVSSPVGVVAGFSSFAMLSEYRAHASRVQATIASAHERVAPSLHAAGVLVETRIAHGKPEHAVIAEARRFDADLIVVGARDQGSLSATLLGSVSRALAETAPIPVLVVRGRAISRVLVATDGSAPARSATEIVASWPLFRDVSTLVVGVGSPPARYGGVVLGDTERVAPFPRMSADSTEQSLEAVDAAVEQLAAPTRTIEREIRLGDPGTEIVAAARAWDADLVAIGAYGESFLRRLLLGSVARKVLDGVGSSVLVARPRHTSEMVDAPSPIV